MKNKTYKILYPVMIAFIGLLIFSSCDSKKVFDGNTKIPDNVWNSGQAVTVKADVEDVTTPANILINIRHAQSYPFSNLIFTVSMKAPDGTVSQDTLNCQLADNKKWRGNGLGDYWDYSVPYKQNVQLQKGAYTFTFHQIMPYKKLPLIMEMGIHMEKVK